MSKDKYIIDIIGTQCIEDEIQDSVTVTTTGDYRVASTGNKFIRYKEYDEENPSVFTLSRSASTSEAVLRRYGELSLPFPSHGRGASVTVTQAISEQISSLDIFTPSPFIYARIFVFTLQ